MDDLTDFVRKSKVFYANPKYKIPIRRENKNQNAVKEYCNTKTLYNNYRFSNGFV